MPLTPAAPYTGRPTDGKDAYWYQRIRVLAQAETIPTAPHPALALIGYATDTGVARNLGRTGAAAGPAALRDRLGREPWHAPANLTVCDLGDVTPDATGSVDAEQQRLGRAVAEARAAGYTTLVLGGGHDLAFGHFLGLRFALDRAGGPHQRLGIVNFDAHLDLRPLTDQRAHSGTPFTQVALHCASLGLPFDYCCYGAQPQANTTALWARAKTLGARVLPLATTPPARDEARAALLAFAQAVDWLHVTVDLDGFPGYISPGVSAPAVDGLTYREVIDNLRALRATGKIVGVDLAECNPGHDLDGRTARLGARLIAELWSG